MYSLPFDFNLPTESVKSLTFKGADRVWLGRAEVTLGTCQPGMWTLVAGTWVVKQRLAKQVVSASMAHQKQRLASFRSRFFPISQLHVPARPFLLCLQALHPRHSHMAVLRQQTTEASPTLEPKWLRTYIYIYIHTYIHISATMLARQRVFFFRLSFCLVPNLVSP